MRQSAIINQDGLLIKGVVIALNKPKIGVLALLFKDYLPLFPGIAQRQDAYVREALAPIGDVEIHFPGPALDRREIEDIAADFNFRKMDGILILMLSYSPGQHLIRAMQSNRLPVALALIQPDETVGEDFEEIDLTVNQGIHGAQDNANCLVRSGIPFVSYAGSRHSSRFRDFVLDFACSARTLISLRSMKIGVIGKLPGMGDVITDDMAVFRKIGPEFVYDSIGAISRYCKDVEDCEIDTAIARDHEVFDVDAKISRKQHEEAARLYLGIKRYLEGNSYAGYTIQFSEFLEDGRFSQLPMLAASHLMAEGHGYAAEGDATCAALVAAMQGLCGCAGFSEMYMMDIKENAILFCHVGEGNWMTARKSRKPRLIDRPLSEGGLRNPPTVVFTPEPGPCAVMSLAHMGGDRFKLVIAKGRVLDREDLRRCDMPYMLFMPDSGCEACVKGWLDEGGTHHEAVVLGDWSSRIEMLCRLAGIEVKYV
jgi:L-arabinose isomerase